MRHQAVGVAILASSHNGKRAGLTATSIASLADEPPCILVCVNRSATAHDVICAANCFTVNFLTADQKDIAELFSGSSSINGEQRFADGLWTPGSSGAPVLKNALATLECDLIDQHQFATHSVFFGSVRNAVTSEHALPLVYFRAGYGSLA